MKHRWIGAALVGAAVALAGCAPDGAQGGDEASPTPAVATPTLEPTEDHGAHDEDEDSNSPEPTPTPTDEYEY